MPKEELTCEGCAGKCCEYVAVELDEPKSKSDFEDMIYYLHHEDVKIAVVTGDDEDELTWYLEFRGRCRYLDPEGWCTIYKQRPEVCRGHKADECEHHAPESFHDIHTVGELLAFMRKIGRGKWASKLTQRVPTFLHARG